MRRAVEATVYRFLAWFESFNSIWQTTMLCVAVGVFEIGWPQLDPHIVAVLVVSLYATFTQNGLAHGNRLTADKVDGAIARIDEVVDQVLVSAETLLRLAQNETGLQETVAAQTEVLVSLVAELRNSR